MSGVNFFYTAALKRIQNNGTVSLQLHGKSTNHLQQFQKYLRLICG